MEVCCLCCADISQGTHLKKRVKLHGAAGKETLVRLDNFVRQIFGVSNMMKRFQKVSDPSALICYKCRDDLKSLNKLEDEANSLKMKLTTLVNNLSVSSASDLSGENDTSRRRLPEYQSNPEDDCTPKRICSGDNSTITQQLRRTSHSIGISSKSSPGCAVTYGYGKPKSYFLSTPLRKRTARRLARRSYSAMMSDFGRSVYHRRLMSDAISQTIRKEIRAFCSKDDSFIHLKRHHVKDFTWSSLLGQLKSSLPTLLHFLTKLIKYPDSNKPLLCLLSSIILKKYNKDACLLQGVISALMYGNGCSKQMYTYLQPLSLCLSHKATLNVIDDLCEDHDAVVKQWRDGMNIHSNGASRDLEVEKDNPISVHGCLELESDDGLWGCLKESIEHANLEQDVSTSSSDTSDSVWETDTEEDIMETSFIKDDNQEESGPMVQDMEMEDCTSEQQQQVTRETGNDWMGYVIVGDNIDKNVRPSFQRIDHTTTSLHHFTAFASKDRINLSEYQDMPGNSSLDVTSLLPSEDDIAHVEKEFTVLISRILVEEMEEFSAAGKNVIWHIPSRYNEEMATLSTLIPLGIIQLNENNLEDMCAILTQLQDDYVPKCRTPKTTVLDNGLEMEYDTYDFHKIVLGGDQLTTARIRGAQAIRSHEDSSFNRLEGIIGAPMDWHTRVVLLKVIWLRLFDEKSSLDKGTFWQLRNILHRTSVPKDPIKNVKGAEDFLHLVLTAYLISASNTVMSACPKGDVNAVAKLITSSFCTVSAIGRGSGVPATQTDGIQVYSKEVITLGLIWLGYHDAVKEGDGDRVLRYWKFLLLLFKIGNRRNYATEAARVLMDDTLLPPRLGAQLRWSRFVNTRGRQGCNIPNDLHMEHLNRRMKSALSHLGSNFTSKAIDRVGKSVGVLHHIHSQFEDGLQLTRDGQRHKRLQCDKDLEEVLACLEALQPFVHMDGRKHSSFNFTCGMFESVKLSELTAWLEQQYYLRTIMTSY